MKDYNSAEGLISKVEKLILEAERQTLNKQPLSREAILALLALDPDSPEAVFLGQAARRVATKVSGNKGKVWAAIGIDYRPCPMNCKFCSFGEDFGAISDSSCLSDEEVIAYAKAFAEEGAEWLSLRTTESYGAKELNNLASEIKNQVGDRLKLVANTGEVNAHAAKDLEAAGFSVAYHVVRLREGSDTPFDPNERLKTLDEIRDSDLDFAALVEPVGSEHTNEEIADSLIRDLDYNVKISGAMARVPVPGTPLGDIAPISEKRLAQIIAVTRLAAGYRAPDICVHPPSVLAMEMGANVVVVDVGAVPRSTAVSDKAWKGFDVKTAKEWFARAGYR